MIDEGQWRVRVAVIHLLGELGKLFGKDLFNKNIEQVFIKYLTNTAAAVRVKGVEKSKELAKLF